MTIALTPGTVADLLESIQFDATFQLPVLLVFQTQVLAEGVQFHDVCAETG